MKLQDLTAHLTGRKFVAFLVTSIFVLAAGLFVPQASAAVVITGLVSALALLITGHTLSDIKLRGPGTGLSTHAAGAGPAGGALAVSKGDGHGTMPA